MVKIEGQDVVLATTEGPSNVFSSTPFILVKPRWVNDTEVNTCRRCDNKFSLVQRKHHCRQCGHILCSKCCKEKIPLPQLGFEDPERICENCYPIAELVTKGRSPLLPFQVEAVRGLSQAVCSTSQLARALELGGVQTLIYLARVNSAEIRTACASSLHSLAMHPVLHNMLVESGTIKALSSILSAVHESEQQTIRDALSALMIFSKSPEFKGQVISNGMLLPILGLCGMKEEISLLAVMILSLIATDQSTHSAIIENERNALSRILALTNSQDEQMQEVALKTLAFLSLGTESHRQRLLQQEVTANRRGLLQVLNGRPKNQQVLVNGMCLLANLATLNEHDQVYLQDYMECSCNLLTSPYITNSDLALHVSRALANFAVYRHHCNHLVHHLTNIVAVCLRSSIPTVQFHGMRTVFSMLFHCNEATTSFLLREGAADVFHGIATTPDLVAAAQGAILKSAPNLAKPTL